MPITLDNLGGLLEGEPSPASSGANLLNYLEGKGLYIGPALSEIYDHWSEEFKARVHQELKNYADRHPESVVPPDGEAILTFLTSWPTCPTSIAEKDLQKAENAFRAMALQVRAFYGREDQDDEVPCWYTG